MKKLKVFLFFFTFLILSNNSNADMPYHLDFKFILNNSVAGKKAQDNLQKRLKVHYEVLYNQINNKNQGLGDTNNQHH